METVRFDSFTLCPQILKALAEEGYTTPTPVQAQAIPVLLEGRDIMATAQTGTGKTAAFSIPILHGLNARRVPGQKGLRALILTPTRELALQIEDSMKTYGRHLPLRTACVLGGVSQFHQVKSLQRNPEILIATPGRLLDLMSQGYIKLDKIEMLVLDEADRMLDMGFVNDVRKIVSRTAANRQTMFFSATMSPEIVALAGSILTDPVRIEVTPPASISVNINQQVYFIDQNDKREMLTEFLRGSHVRRALVFTRTKHRADRISNHLEREGIPNESIHSNKTQSARQKALAAFDKGRVRVLVATDIVARGIDVDGITHVVNFELPDDPESYVHRIGRTARAGAEGIAVSLCDSEEVWKLRGIEKLTQTPLTLIEDHKYHSTAVAQMHQRTNENRKLPASAHYQRRGRSAGRSSSSASKSSRRWGY